MGWQHAATPPRGLGLGIGVSGLGALGGSYGVRGSISHSSLATSSGQHRSDAAVLLMGDTPLPNPEAQRKGTRGIREGVLEYAGPLELGERSKETVACPVLQHPLYISPVWQGQEEQSLIHTTLA